MSRLQSNAGTTFSTVVQSALCLRNQPVWHTILDKEALKKDNLRLSLVTGAETWASTEPDGHSGAGQLPGAWVSVASETEKTFAYFLALLNYSKRAHKSRAKRVLKNERKDALGGQKPTGPKRSVQPLVVTIKLHSNCFRPSSSLALSLSLALSALVIGCAPVNMQQDFYLNATPFLNQIPTPGRESLPLPAFVFRLFSLLSSGLLIFILFTLTSFSTLRCFLERFSHALSHVPTFPVGPSRSPDPLCHLGPCHCRSCVSCSSCLSP